METTSGSVILGWRITFLLYWLLSAMRVKPMAEWQSVWSALAHRIPLGCRYYLLAYPKLPPPMNRVLMPRDDWVLTAGTAICVLGLCVTFWTLDGNWSSDVSFKQGHKLIRTGLYRFVRHPIYTGL